MVVQLAVGALVTGVVGTAGVAAAKRIGRWFVAALKASMEDAVNDIVAPQIRAVGDSLGHSLDEMRVSNSADHGEVQTRLVAVESRMGTVEDRMAALEKQVASQSTTTTVNVGAATE